MSKTVLEPLQSPQKQERILCLAKLDRPTFITSFINNQINVVILTRTNI